MQQENKDSREGKELNPAQTDEELSEVWQELLGARSGSESASVVPGEGIIPTLDSDPWSELLQAKGIEVVDLQAVHLPISDQDVEQMLQVMQEQPAQDQTDTQA